MIAPTTTRRPVWAFWMYFWRVRSQKTIFTADLYCNDAGW